LYRFIVALSLEEIIDLSLNQGIDKLGGRLVKDELRLIYHDEI